MTYEYELGKANLEMMRAFTQRVISDAVETEEKPELEKVVDELEKLIGGLPRFHRMGILTFLRLLDIGPLAMGFRRAFVHLSTEEQLKYLYSLETSRNYIIRSIVQALKGIVLLVYFSEPEAENAVGYDGACLLNVNSAKSSA